MLELTSAYEFISEVSQEAGANQPLKLRVIDGNSTKVTAYVKLSNSITAGIDGLIIEAISAMLAIDLDLPVPRPILVKIEPAFISSVPAHIQKRLNGAVSPTFATEELPEGYAILTKGMPIEKKMLLLAARIFAYDALIDNMDRGGNDAAAKPNCLIKGEELAIIDHEKCFQSAVVQFMLGGGHLPWKLGGLARYEAKGSHLFIDQLRKHYNKPDFNEFVACWNRLTDDRLEMYVKALPSEWVSGPNCAAKVAGLIKQVRDNITACVQEVERILRKAA